MPKASEQKRQKSSLRQKSCVAQNSEIRTSLGGKGQTKGRFFTSKFTFKHSLVFTAPTHTGEVFLRGGSRLAKARKFSKRPLEKG